MTGSEQQYQGNALTDREVADAIVTVARLLPKVRNVRGGGVGMVHPWMPEDDAALQRTIRALIDRGDHLADALRWAQDARNALFQKWHDTGKLEWEDFEDGVGASGPVYEWQKSRERLAWAAEHRHVEAWEASRAGV